jgi:hypothetical protein
LPIIELKKQREQIMSRTLTNDLEGVLGAIAGILAQDGMAREVAILANSKASILHTDHDNWDGGIDGYTIYLEIPAHLYTQLADKQTEVEELLKLKAQNITRLYPQEWIQAFVITTELPTDDGWREKAKTWLNGKGVTNQGRVRSDNIAPLICDGLLFRSQPEIHLYRALRSLGVTLSPLPVFIRGGETYRRIEPDFVLLKDGIMMIVEVDGDTVHKETPQEAHDRVTMLLHEGAHVERVNAKDCDTAEKARACAARIMSIMAKLKTNK